MQNQKLNGLIKEIIERSPNLDIVDFLQQNLQLPTDKAEALAARIEKQYLQKTSDPKHPSIQTAIKKPEKSEPAPARTYSVGSLSGKEFEHFVTWLLAELGFEVPKEKRTVVLGFDFLAVKNGEKTVVLAIKTPKNCRVSDSVFLLCQESMRFYGCEHAIILSTAYFTEKTVVDAQRLGVELWDGDTFDKKIAEVKKNSDLPEKQACFPPFNGSLLQCLLALDETEDFIVEPRAGGKCDLYLSGGKFPLLTFQVHSDEVIRCVFRIKNNQPVSEFDGVPLIGSNSNNCFGPDLIRVYTLIIQYLKNFLE